MLCGVKPRVLVVDDEVGVRRALERGLSAEGMEVVTVGDGRQAIEKLDEVLPDIVLVASVFD